MAAEPRLLADREDRSRRNPLKQPHTEDTVRHTGDQQNTGTHKKPGSPEEKGADRFGGSRAGKENVEPAEKKPA